MNAADDMLARFKRHLRAETVPAEAVCLISEHGVTALPGSHIERLAPGCGPVRAAPSSCSSTSISLPGVPGGTRSARRSTAYPSRLTSPP